MASRRRVRRPVLIWQPLFLTDDWLSDLWELQCFGGLQLTPDRRLYIALR